MRTEHPLYWACAGALIGFGLISFDIFFIAYPCLLTGLVLVIYGSVRLGMGGFWAAVTGFGGLPALILLWDIVTAPPPCSSGGFSHPSTASQVACGYTPTSYYLFAVLFAAIALAGGIWSFIRRRRSGHGE